MQDLDVKKLHISETLLYFCLSTIFNIITRFIAALNAIVEHKTLFNQVVPSDQNFDKDYAGKNRLIFKNLFSF